MNLIATLISITKPRVFINSLSLLILFVLGTQYANAAMRLPSANRECASCHVMWLTEFKREDVATLIPYDPRPVMPTGKQDVASAEPMCFSCHDGFVLDSRFQWQQGQHAHPVGVKPSSDIKIPVVEGKKLFPLNDDGKVYCGTCHTAHGVEWGQQETAVFMRVRNDDGILCSSCHKSRASGSKHGNHPVNVKIQDLLDGPPVELMKAGARFSREGGVVCQSCHRPHASPEKKLLLMNNEKSRLCGQCHIDRYAMNLKQAAQMKTHPVNIVPQNLEIPEELVKSGARLGPDGELICQTCHQPHGALPETGLLITANKQGSLCQSCHQDKKIVLDSKHDMVLVSADSQNMHKQSAEKTGACGACHLPHKGSGPKMWARPVDAEQEPMAALCLSCHNRQGIAEKHLVGEYSHPVGVDLARLGQTVKLPGFDIDGFKTAGGMSGKVTCASCHDPHQWSPDHPQQKGEPGEAGNSQNRFLRMANDREAKLCKQCHTDKWEIASTKHDMRYMAPDSENALGQTVEESGICGSCHLVHNARAAKLWARNDLQGQGTGYIACIGCHNKDGVAKDKALDLNHTHPMDVTLDNLAINITENGWFSQLMKGQLVSLPVYDNRGMPVVENGRVGCGTCHDPHKWSPLAFRKTDQPGKEEGDMDSSFLRIADQGKSQLCLNCHQSKQSILSTSHDLTLSQSKSDKHKGVCMHCHQPHETRGPALWARNQSDESRAPIARLCLDCHKKDGVAKNKHSLNHSHPLAVKIGDLENTNKLPVFDDEGNRVDHDGNVDCASCHNPHQWDPGNTQLKTVKVKNREGDTTNSYLRLTANKQSDLCVNCHADKKMIRGTDHDLSITVSGARNKLEQVQDVSGLCGQCHIPHYAEKEKLIWARPAGKGNEGIEQACRSCHQSGQIAENKAPVQGNHPAQVNMWSTELRKAFKDGQLPETDVFDEQGKRTRFGAITCASCHNAHQWSVIHNKAGAGKNIEGDANSSFLRVNDTANIVCADCHDKDGLFRYKYYHSESSHRRHHMFK